jgi:hypothetical protein
MPSTERKRLPRVDLYLRFYGETFDPDEITKRLGVEPTYSFRPGDPITKDGKGKRRDYGWMIEVKGFNPWENDDLLREFRQRVAVSPEAVRQLCRDLSINPVVICGVGIRDTAESAPDLYFPNEFLAWIAELGASLNVDVLF